MDSLLDGGLNYFDPDSKFVSQEHGIVRDSLRTYLAENYPNKANA